MGHWIPPYPMPPLKGPFMTPTKIKQYQQFEDKAFRNLCFTLGIIDLETYDIPTIMNLATKTIQQLNIILKQIHETKMQSNNGVNSFLTSDNLSKKESVGFHAEKEINENLAR